MRTAWSCVILATRKLRIGTVKCGDGLQDETGWRCGRFALELTESVEIAVVLFQSDPAADDQAILRDLANCGVDEATAVRLVQFVPIAFTRFMYRASGVRFADHYVVLGGGGQPAAQRPIAEEPALVLAMPGMHPGSRREGRCGRETVFAAFDVRASRQFSFRATMGQIASTFSPRKA